MILIEFYVSVERFYSLPFLYSFHLYAFRQLSTGIPRKTASFLAAFRRFAGGFPAAFLEGVLF